MSDWMQIGVVAGLCAVVVVGCHKTVDVSGSSGEGKLVASTDEEKDPAGEDEEASSDASDEEGARSRVEKSASESTAETNAPSTSPDFLWGTSIGGSRIGFEIGCGDDVISKIREEGPMEYRPEDWPEPYRNLREIDVLTPEGPLKLALEEVVTDYDGSSFSCEVVSERSAKLAGEREWTVVMPGGQMAPSTRLTPPEPSDVPGELVTPVWRTFVDGFDAERIEQIVRFVDPASNRESLRGLNDTARYMRAYDLPFPSGYDYFVTVNVCRSEDLCYSGAYLASADGEKLWTVEESHGGGASLEVLNLADPDGDGVPGVLYEHSMDTHPYYIEWFDFDGGKPVVDRLKTIG